MKNLFVLALIASVAFLGACGDSHEVEVHFHNPTDGAVVATADASALEIEIDFESEEELHEVEIKLYPTDTPADLIIDYDGHDHEANYVFKQTVDISSYESGTIFTLEAITCEDHDCTESHTATATFTLE